LTIQTEKWREIMKWEYEKEKVAGKRGYFLKG
jgi:hypothetical protein